MDSAAMPSIRKQAVMPTFDGLTRPLTRGPGSSTLGGVASGSIEEVYAKTVEVIGLSEEVLAQMHDPEKSSQTEVGYTPRVGSDVS
jgi:restriction system protein